MLLAYGIKLCGMLAFFSLFTGQSCQFLVYFICADQTESDLNSGKSRLPLVILKTLVFSFESDLGGEGGNGYFLCLLD